MQGFSRIKKIQYNCRKATYLIEKKQFTPLTIGERVELRIHLAGCSVCRLFERQSIMINALVRTVFDSPNIDGTALDDEFKKELQYRIDREIDR
jgi:hypothetical protein